MKVMFAWLLWQFFGSSPKGGNLVWCDLKMDWLWWRWLWCWADQLLPPPMWQSNSPLLQSETPCNDYHVELMMHLHIYTMYNCTLIYIYRKWENMTQNDTKWHLMAQFCTKWHRFSQCGKNGRKWLMNGLVVMHLKTLNKICLDFDFCCIQPGS